LISSIPTFLWPKLDQVFKSQILKLFAPTACEEKGIGLHGIIYNIEMSTHMVFVERNGGLCMVDKLKETEKQKQNKIK
jgi:hypothetical protein